jgi:hypothetical protein
MAGGRRRTAPTIDADAVWVAEAEGSLSRATCAVCRAPVGRKSGGVRLGSHFYCPRHFGRDAE